MIFIVLTDFMRYIRISIDNAKYVLYELENVCTLKNKYKGDELKMAKQKDITYFTATEMSSVRCYLLEVSISASNVHIALLQIGLLTKDMLTNDWIPTEKGEEFAVERTYKDKKTGEEKMFYVWHRDTVKILKEHFEKLKIGSNK